MISLYDIMGAAYHISVVAGTQNPRKYYNTRSLKMSKIRVENDQLIIGVDDPAATVEFTTKH